MAIKEIGLTRQDKHGGRLVSFRIDDIADGDMIRFKDSNTLEAGSLADFQADPIVGISETISDLDGGTVEFDNGIAIDSTPATPTLIADGEQVVTFTSGETLTFNWIKGRCTSLVYDDGAE